MNHISIDKELENFNKYVLNCKRGVLSARFGDGKSTFLKEFKDKFKDRFEFIELHPLNYQVASNEDIFEYIKRDIIIQLADKKEALDFDFDLEALGNQIFNWESLSSVIDFILSFAPGGNIYSKFLQKAHSIQQKYKEAKQTSDKYKEIFKVQKGGIYEDDAYTILIKSTIERINHRDKGPRETVLLIEDMDRIDPAHLFRILNVMGAHIDDVNDKNKFSFDHVILVMDYNTTEHIFHHFYGENADYVGYMSKFVSPNPFLFSIKRTAMRHFEDYLSEKCLINNIAEVELNSVGIKSLYNVVNSLSVRQISAIIGNNFSNVYQEEILLDEHGHKKSPLCPLSRLLSILVQCNVRFSKSRLIKSLRKTQKLPYMMHHMLFTSNTFRANPVYIIDNRAYILRYVYDSSVKQPILRSEETDPSIYHPENETRAIEEVFDIICQYVNGANILRDV